MNKNWKLGEFLLLLSQFLERIAHYAISANLTNLLIQSPLQWKNYNAIAAPLLLNGFCFISSMTGGILSDIYFRKTTTIILGYFFYVAYVGFPIVFSKHIPCISSNKTSSSGDEVNIFDEKCAGVLLPAIILSACGSGLIRSVVASLGADMANNRWENPSTYFNLYYWCLNGGSLVALLGFSALQNYSKKWGLIIPTIILGISFVTFLLGGPFYVHRKKPSRSTVSMIFAVYLEAFRKKFSLMKARTHRQRNLQHSQEHLDRKIREDSIFSDEEEVDSEFPDNLNISAKDDSQENRSEFDSYTYPKRTSINQYRENGSSSSKIIETESDFNTENVSFLDHCQIRFGGTFTEVEVQDVRRFTFILVVIIFMVPYYMLYFQMESTYMYQAIGMKVEIVPKGFSVPAPWLIVLDVMLLMILLPVLAKVVYPWLRKKKMYVRQTSKMALGLLFVCISIIIAGVVEKYRLQIMWDDNNTVYQTIDNQTVEAANMNVFFQVPQFIFMGLSEALAVVSGLELACTQVSASMQGLANGMFWFASGLGSFIGTGSLYGFRMIEFKNNYNCTNDSLKCNLDYYFYMLAGFIFLVLMIFLLFLSKYRRLERVEQNQLLMRRISS